MSMRRKGEIIGKLGGQFLERSFNGLREFGEGGGLTEERGRRDEGLRHGVMTDERCAP
jgi:hypothetical protein